MSTREIIRNAGRALGIGATVETPEGFRAGDVNYQRFEHTAWGFYLASNPEPTIPSRVPIYTVDENVTRVIVEGIGIKGRPVGIFYGRSSYALDINKSGTLPEYRLSSQQQDATVTTGALIRTQALTGLRYAVLGDLQDLMPVNIELRQRETLGLLITSSSVELGAGAVNMTVTVIIRIRGRIEYAAV